MFKPVTDKTDADLLWSAGLLYFKQAGVKEAYTKDNMKNSAPPEAWEHFEFAVNIED